MSFSGNLTDLSLGDVLQIVGLSKKSGVLTLEETKAATIKIIFLQGRAIGAQTRNSVYQLARTLRLQDQLSPEHFYQLIESMISNKPEKTLRETLSTDYQLSTEQIDAAIQQVIESMIFQAFRWNHAEFSFEESDVATEKAKLENEQNTLLLDDGLSPEYLAIEGGRFDIPADESNPFDTQEEFVDPMAELAEEMADDDISTDSRREDSADIYDLKSMLDEMNDPSNSANIPLMILRFASKLLNRAVLFRVHKQNLVGLGQFGLTEDPSEGNKTVRAMELPLEEIHILQKGLVDRRALHIQFDSENDWDKYILNCFGGEPPEEAFVGPIMARGKPLAVLYGDNLPEKTLVQDTEVLEIFLSQAGYALERNFELTN